MVEAHGRIACFERAIFNDPLYEKGHPLRAGRSFIAGAAPPKQPA